MSVPPTNRSDPRVAGTPTVPSVSFTAMSTTVSARTSGRAGSAGRLWLVGAIALLPGLAACSSEDSGSLADVARETASSVQDEANAAIEDATGQIDDAAADLQGQVTGLDEGLQSSIDDVRQQAEQVASDAAAEGDAISEQTRQSFTDLQDQVGQVDEQLSVLTDVPSAVTAAWEAFLASIDQLGEQIRNAGG